MQRVVDYWFRYRVAKALLGWAILVVFIMLGVLVWRAFLRVAALAAGGALATALAALSLETVMANIHGAAAQCGSLPPMLLGTSGGPLAGTLAQIRQQLADRQNSPALEVIISDYARFHPVMAVEGAIVVVVLIVLNVRLWRRFTRTDRAD